MQSRLKKTLYLGLAVLSLGSVAALSTNASAKSKASDKVTASAYKELKSDPSSRNVILTGSNAIYDKPGTLSGARIVASKATVGKLAATKSSADLFRAYGVKTTSRGSVYYRIVSMAGNYRGYIYGGKSDTAFDGGLKAFATTKDAALPTRTTGYYLKDISKNTLWTAPKNTQYGASKSELYGAVKTDKFTVDKAVTKSLEGSLYYHVTDASTPSISGWIYAGKGYVAGTSDASQDLGGLSFNLSDAAATADNSVNVVYRDASGATVGSSTWVTATAGSKAGATVDGAATNAAGVKLADFIANALPANYQAVGTLPTSGVYGNTVYVNVTAASTSKVQLVADNVDNSASTDSNPVAGTLSNGAKLSASDLSATLSAKGVGLLTGAKGDQIGEANLNAIAGEIGSAAINGSKNYYAADGTAYHYVFTFEPTPFPTDNRLANYGDTLTASFKAVLTKGSSSVATSDTGWIAD